MSVPSLVRSNVRHELVAANHIPARERVLDAYGHVSIRHREVLRQYVMARSLSPELATEHDLQCFGLEGQAAYMEKNAHLQMQARALGQVRYLSPEIERASQMLLSGFVAERVWQCWRERVGMGE